MSFANEKQLEDTFVMHTFGRKPVELVRGEGMYVYDDEGNKYLDFIAGIGAVSLGHCHPVVVDALTKQAQTLIHVSNYYYIEQRGELSELLSDLLNARVPAAERTSWQTFFANSGAEANECAIKLARLYARKSAAATEKAADGAADGATNKATEKAANEAAPNIIVTLQNSFHGRTLATLAATAQPAKQEAFQPLPGGFVATPQNDIAALTELFEQCGERICAVMLECVQGESGVHPCTPAFLHAARELTQRYDALLICDEVQCGIFRCGTYPFGFQHFDITPDIVTIAKGVASGMPTGMCAAREEVARAFEPGDHGSTFGGSCLAVAAANATLRELSGGDYGAHVEEVGAYFRERLSALPQVSEVRGYGLMVAVDLDESARCAPDVVSAALSEGLLLNATGAHTLRFLPPLVCERADIDELMRKLTALL